MHHTHQHALYYLKDAAIFLQFLLNKFIHTAWFLCGNCFCKDALLVRTINLEVHIVEQIDNAGIGEGVEAGVVAWQHLQFEG